MSYADNSRQNTLTASVEHVTRVGHADPIEFGKLDLRAGEIACVVGPSGAGKTTLLRALAGDSSLKVAGHMTYESAGSAVSVGEAAKRGWLGLFLPDTGLPPWQVVSKILLLPASLNNNLVRPTSAEIEEALASLHLSGSVLTKTPGELSLGMRHRVLLALALLYRPRFLFIDELLASIDSPTVSLIIPVLKDFVAREGCTCLLTTHDLDRAYELASQFYYKGLHQGLLAMGYPAPKTLAACFLNDRNKLDRRDESQ
jgi:NitT/TauT family transport system ATP-binding protein